jgi:hypothetical protein
VPVVLSNLLKGSFLFAVVLLVLSACGGGGGGNNNNQIPQIIEYPVTGAAVKGPLANANVTVYQLDPHQADLKGAIVASGTTTEEAAFTGLMIQAPLVDVYLIEVTATVNTVDISTGQAPILQTLRGIKTSTQLIDGVPSSVTPLSSLAIELGRLNSSADATPSQVVENINIATATVIVELGFGLDATTNLFTTPAIINDDDSTGLSVIVGHRTAIEAITALLALLQENSTASTDELLMVLAQDLSDDSLDGLTASGPVQGLAEITNFSELLATTTIAQLAIPNTDQDGDPATDDPYTVDEVEQLLVVEATAMGITTNISALTDGSITIIPAPLSPDFDGDGIPDLTDPDSDNDGVNNDADAFPLDPSETMDTDEDGIGDNTDPDIDGDGVDNGNDAFPLDASETADADNDGVGNNADLDDDNDGVNDMVDAFPLDPSESADSDGDGVGNNADAYPNDAGCHVSSHGNGIGCYATLLGTVYINKVVADDNGVIYLHIPEWSNLIRFDTQSQEYLDPVTLNPLLSLSSFAYSPSHQRIYLGYTNGQIYYIDLSDNLGEVAFANVPLSVNGLAAVGQFLLAQDGSGAWNTHYVFDMSGMLADSVEWNRYSRAYAWNETLNRVYFFRDQTSPNDLHYEVINQTTGAITADGETPYHGDYSIQPPIRISQDGALVLLGSGDLYHAETLVWHGSIGASFDDAQWMSDGGLITLVEILGHSRVERRDASLNAVIEQLSFSGVPLGLFSTPTDYIVLTQDVSGVQFHVYQPSDDSDGDGVPNLEDAFPVDVAASLDSDNDGYPDSWNTGYTEADSTTGLTLDSYPQDSACYLPQHGDGTLCDYSSTMPVFTPDKVEIDNDGIVYLLSTENNRIFRWSAATSSFINPIHVGSTDVLSPTSPTQMTYSPAHQRLYLGYTSGAISAIDLNVGLIEQPFSYLSMSVNGLASVGQYLLAQDNSGAWESHHIFDINGVLTDSVEWNQYSRVYAWNEVNDRVYFFRDTQSPNDLHYEVVDQTTGFITAEGETPYHGTYPIIPPIRLSPDGSQVILGSGNVYDANSMVWLRAISTTFNDAVWFQDAIVTTSDNVTNSQIQVWNPNTAEMYGSYVVSNSVHALLPYGIDMVQVTTGVTGVSLSVVAIGDHDLDGLPAWWETLNGLSDTDANDATLDGDADGLSNLDEFNQRTNPVAVDTDGDGISDGNEVNVHFTDPLVIDTDGDGLTDGEEVNVVGSNPLAIDTDTDGIIDSVEVNSYGTNPLSSDSDNDGLDDLWEVTNGLDPLVDDANGDSDSDGLTNAQELTNGTDPNNNDTDNDGLTDGDEVNVHQTNPNFADTDGDRMRDGWEVTHGFDPLSNLDAELDADSDGFNNLAEHFLGTDPNDALSVPVVPVWSTYQGDASHNGFVPVYLDPTDFAQRWTVSPLSGRALHPVTAADGRVFVSESTYYSANQTIMALNASDGSIAWENGYGNFSAINPPAYANGTVYVQTSGWDTAYVRGLDAATGALVFRSSFNDQSGRFLAPTPYAGNVYVNGGTYGGAYGFDGSTGAEHWFTTLNQDDGWTPAVDDTSVYAFTGDGMLTVINRATGAVEYTISDTTNSYSWNGAPILGTNQNIVVANGSLLTNFDLTSQSIGWQVSGNYSGQPAVALGKIYAVNSGALNVVDELTGGYQWAWEPPGGGSLSGNMIVTMNLIFVQDNTTTYAIDLNTHLSVWSYPAVGHLSLSDEGALYIATTGGSLIAIEISGDDDGDGILQWWENRYGLSDTDPTDALLDPDADGLNNLGEFNALTDPNISDTDNDGLNDGDEINVHLTDPLNADTDGDGITDGDEVNVVGSDPLVVDTDADGLSDFDEVNFHNTDPISADSDADGMNDGWEVANGLDPLVDDANGDTDADGLVNSLELTHGSDPNNADTDGDGLNDGDEVNSYLTDPVLDDSDGDRLSDGWEITYGLDPLSDLDAQLDTDNDGFINLVEQFLNTDPTDALSVPVVPAWSTYQGNAAHTGFVPLLLDPADFNTRWSVNPFPGASLNPVTAADGKVFVSVNSYFGGNQSISALDAIDGSSLWTNNYGGIHSIDPPAYANNTVYYQTGGHGDSFIRGVNAQTGALIFQSSYGNQWSRYYAPTPYDGNVYINGGYYGGAYGFDGTTGSQLWFANLSQYDEWTPAVDDNYVYAYTGGTAQLSVLDRFSGLQVYTIADPDYNWFGYAMNMAPVLGNHQNVLVINGGRLINFDLQSQSVGWQLSENFSGQPSVAFGQVFTVNSGALNVLDEETGEHLWAWAPAGGGAVTGNIVVTLDHVFVQDATTTYAIDLATHLPVWSYPASGHLALSNEGALYITSSSGMLVAINISGDEDADAMPGWWEARYGLDDTNPADAALDNDTDGLTNLQEYENFTNPLNADTDNDSLSDGDEVNINLTNPRVFDTDNDGLGDGDEVITHMTNPLLADTDLDGFSDGEEINRYGTDPNDALSAPQPLTNYIESFESGDMPAGWITAQDSNADWFIDNSFANSGSYSIRSGAITHSQQSGVTFTGLFAAGTLSFSTRIDAESCCDELQFYVDGVMVYSLGVNTTWTAYQTNLSAGEHTLEWRYTKDPVVTGGADAAWIDDLTFSGL